MNIKSKFSPIIYVIFHCVRVFQIHGQTPSAQDAETRKWLEEHVFKLDQLEANTGTFSQMQELKKAIGEKQIVLLGEQTHGDGTTFKAKEMLVKFLHQEMGFEILAFESGFYQTYKAWQELKNGAPIETTTSKSIHGRWTSTSDMVPVFDYVQEKSMLDDKLILVGMDVLFDGDYVSSIAKDFEEFMKSKPGIIFSTEWSFVKKMVNKMTAKKKYLPEKSDQDSFYTILDKMIENLDASLDEKHGWNTPSFWAQVWKNYKANTQNNLSLLDGSFSRHIFFSRRDEMMAKNIAWFAATNKKIIVWASVTHNLPVASDALLRQMNWPVETKFMGEYLKELVGRQNMFNLTFTGYEGTYADVYRNFRVVPFDRPSKGSLEHILSEHKKDNCFFMMDPATLPDWLTKPFKASFIFNKEYEALWYQAIDAVFFTRKMEATKTK